MKKINSDSPKQTQLINNGNGPTLRDLELILKRIEELDSKREGLFVESIDSKEAA